jgi:hypothetical protein
MQAALSSGPPNGSALHHPAHVTHATHAARHAAGLLGGSATIASVIKMLFAIEAAF